MKEEQDIEQVPWEWSDDSLKFACAICPLKDVSEHELVAHVIASHPYRGIK